jgi:undecaprenyl pyrophosphate phosphatase UppP
MGKLKNYNTGDHMMDNSEISIQISNAIIILFPIIGLFFTKYIDRKYRTTFCIGLSLIIIEGIISVINHMFEHNHRSTGVTIVEWLDTIGAIILMAVGIMIVFGYIMNNDANKNNIHKKIFRVYFIVIIVIMLATLGYSWRYRSKHEKDNGISHEDNINIYNQYHNIWHMGSAMIIILTILYVFCYCNNPSVVAL